jgi:hypothetical protein
LRLQLLHALLQAINPGLTLGTLARQRRALPLLHQLLSLLDALLTRLRTRLDLFLSSAERGRCGRARWSVDAGRGLCHRRTLRRGNWSPRNVR